MFLVIVVFASAGTCAVTVTLVITSLVTIFES
jgi:hypothetical protein